MTTAEPVMQGDRKVYPVDAFNARLRDYVGKVRDVWIEGETTTVNRNDARPTVFLTLKGESGACLDLWIARSRFDALGPALEPGERVLAFGGLELLEKRGKLLFRATGLERTGAGDHRAAFEALKRKLAAEGLFAEERKRPLPRFPRAIGVVTGRRGAARGDILTALAARFPAAHVVVLETAVQGTGAPAAVAAGLARLAAHPGVDVVIVARGGGSADDLAAFDDERLVRAVAACPLPVVSAVGHEQDVTLCDLVADARAATPTAAVKLVVPDAAELRAALDRARERSTSALRRDSARQRERLELRCVRLRAAPRLLLERRRAALDTCGARLQTLSPTATLQRGYAIVRHAGVAVREAGPLAPGAELVIELARGGVDARVEKVRP